ncbi:hypothetical protein EYZ11_004202 [Aspergillus tanneri]|uniref:Nonribosomal peptide synthetases (NRPS) n=1 Tax=Aspergillus tanneri TaxID=1220188 RepID=A0A4S3JNG8_9EURO|nr:Nonribosomal peptide synthetases (NRPS) [Aspergillus tanneri]KAA8647996.1 Nonribosomal peptide synthetases (NRPS) [Aspergillus tanneri]THC96297.1 hypothetical protein EYZ11_004202 [Aspergillus tanneri]
MANALTQPIPQSYVYEEVEPPHDHLIVLLDKIADQRPHQRAICSLHQTNNAKTPDADEDGETSLCWTFSQLQSFSFTLAAVLICRGVAPRENIVAILHNQAEWALVFWAALRMGCPFIPLDPRMLDHSEDLSYIIGEIGPAAVFVSDGTMAEKMDPVLPTSGNQPSVKCMVSSDGCSDRNSQWTVFWDMICRQPSHTSRTLQPLDKAETALIVYTSGTTSRSKACPHQSLSVTVAAQWIRDTLCIAPNYTICQHLPAFHSYSITFTLAYWLAGATVVFPKPSFDPASTLETLKRFDNVHIPCVPSMLEALKDYLAPGEGLPRPPFSISLGGAPVTMHTLEQAKALSATRVIVGYGTTEGFINLLNIMDGSALDSVGEAIPCGRTFPGLGVRICGPNSRIPVPRGQAGELHQGGLAVFAGYLNDTSAKCYRENGCFWFPTGDEALMDETGNVHIMGRYKDLIIRGGENISPLKLEQCLMKITEVQSAHVVGIPDSVAGEVPVAIVTRSSGHDLPVHSIQRKVVEELGPAFAPRIILDLRHDLKEDSYPKTMAGKVHKATLKQWVVDYLKKSPSLRTSSNDVLVDVQRCWASVTGLVAESMDIDVPVRSFVDSLSSIQFCHIASGVFRTRITSKDLVIFDTIQKQAEFFGGSSSSCRLINQNEPSCSETPPSSRHTVTYPGTKAAIATRLEALGLTSEHVEDVFPMTDLLKRMSRDSAKPDRWNVRISWMADPSIDLDNVESILQLWVRRHPLLRTTAVSVGDKDYYVVMRPTQRLMNLQIRKGGHVTNPKALTMYRIDCADHWAPVTGPMCKATTLQVQQPPSIGVIITMHHAIYDAFTLIQWIKDLKRLFRGEAYPLNIHPYSEFAADYERFRMKDSAKQGVNFHVQRLMGITSSGHAIWPPGRTTRDDKITTSEATLPVLATEVKEGKGVGTEAVTRLVHLPRISQVRKKLGLTTAAVAKAACVLFNVHKTGAKEAIFATTNLGRSRPLNDDATATGEVVNPLLIDGPTVTCHVERIPIESNETAAQLLTRVATLTDELENFLHAPLDQIISSLERLDQANDTQDAAVLASVFERQFFTYLGEQYVEEETDPIKLLHTTTRADLGFVWFPHFRNDSQLELNVTFRDGLLGEKEVSTAMSEYLSAIQWKLQELGTTTWFMQLRFCRGANECEDRGLIATPTRNRA